MKGFITIILLFFLFVNFSLLKAQTYMHFIKEGKTWTELSSPSVYPMFSINTYKMQGDTLVNGNLYKKVIKNNISYAYLLREDTVLKRVYCKGNWNNYEYLLYDFNLQIGDTLDSNYCTIVVSKSIEYFAGKYREKWIFNSWDSTVCYEGIGYLTSGVFYLRCITGGLEWLLCYFEDDSLVYHNSELNDSCFTLVNAPENNNSNFNVYFTNNTLTVNPVIPVEFTVNVYDIMGREVYEKEAYDKVEIIFSELMNGLYFYRINLNKSNIILSNKFIIRK